MESYIQISKLNDFIFCPMSVYFHSFYENYEEKIYHGKSQTVGKIAHDNIDKGKYSTARRYLQGLPIYSSRFNLMGKIDIYDSDKKFLIERKYKVNKIYRGYLLQLYAQFFCLEEMGIETGYDLNKVIELGRYVQQILGQDTGSFILKAGRCSDIAGQNK